MPKVMRSNATESISKNKEDEDDMSGGSCSLYIEGKGKVSVSIGGSPSMPSISFTGLHGRRAVGYDIARVCEKAAIRCALRSAGFDIPRASIRIDVDVSAHEFRHMCIENACAQGIAIASGQAAMPEGSRVAATPIEIDGSTLRLEPIKDGIERGLDDLCDEKQAEADLVEETADRDEQLEHKESGR